MKCEIRNTKTEKDISIYIHNAEGVSVFTIIIGVYRDAASKDQIDWQLNIHLINEQI